MPGRADTHCSHGPASWLCGELESGPQERVVGDPASQREMLSSLPVRQALKAPDSVFLLTPQR